PARPVRPHDQRPASPRRREHGQDGLDLRARPRDRLADPRYEGAEGPAVGTDAHGEDAADPGRTAVRRTVRTAGVEEVEGPGPQAGPGRLHLPAVLDESLHGDRADRPRRRRLAAVELQPEDRLHVRLL